LKEILPKNYCFLFFYKGIPLAVKLIPLILISWERKILKTPQNRTGHFGNIFIFFQRNNQKKPFIERISWISSPSNLALAIFQKNFFWEKYYSRYLAFKKWNTPNLRVVG